MPLLEVENK